MPHPTVRGSLDAASRLLVPLIAFRLVAIIHQADFRNKMNSGVRPAINLLGTGPRPPRAPVTTRGEEACP